MTTEFICEVAFTSADIGYALWGTAIWDAADALWGPGVVYTDLSSRIRSLSTNRRFSDTMDRWQAGSGTAVLNNRDGDLSPSNLAGTYVVDGVTTILPARRILLAVTQDGVRSPLLAGVIDDWQEEIIQTGPGAGDAVIRVSIVDDWAELAAIDGLAGPSVGAGDTFGARIERILTNAGHTWGRAIDVGEATMQATTMGSAPTQDIVVTAKAEGGVVWPDAEGTMRGGGRYALIEKTASITVQATFADDDVSFIPYANPQYSYRRDLITNVAAYTADGGTTQTVDDIDSIAAFGYKRDVEDGLVCQTDAQALSLAEWRIALYARPQRCVSQVTVYPLAGAAAWASTLLALRERHLVRVINNPPGGFETDEYAHVMGITHTAEPGIDWKITYQLWPAGIHVGLSTARWDVGLWDSARWMM